MWNSPIQNSGWHLVNQITRSKKSSIPKENKNMHVKEKRSSNLNKITIFMFNHPIFVAEYKDKRTNEQYPEMRERPEIYENNIPWHYHCEGSKLYDQIE